MKRIIFLLAFITLAISSFAQVKEESLKIVWPAEYNWKTISDQQDKLTHFVEMIPGSENVDTWDTLCTTMSLKQVKISTTNKIVKMYRESSRKESPRAQLTVLEASETNPIWVIFKIEAESFPGDPFPESQLYYAIQGQSTLFVNFIAIKKKELSPEFVATWSKFFKSSELILQ